MSEADFARAKVPGSAPTSRANSPAPSNASATTTDGNGNIKYKGWVMVKGKKCPRCCMKFLNTGKCDNEEKSGKPCRYKHMDKEHYDKEIARLNKTS